VYQETYIQCFDKRTEFCVLTMGTKKLFMVLDMHAGDVCKVLVLDQIIIIHQGEEGGGR
jgi:hypothetical protein